MQKPTILFDLDNTLIRTEQIKKGFYQIAEANGFDLEGAKRIYKKARTTEDGAMIKITLDHFLTVLESDMDRPLDRNSAYEVFTSVCAHGLQFEGVDALISDLEKRGVNMKLLTLGVKDWQNEKIRVAGLDRYFSEKQGNILYAEQVNGGKIDMIKQVFGQDFTGKNFVLFNDKPDETRELLNAFDDLKVCIHNEHVSDAYPQEKFDKLKEEFRDRVLYGKTFKEASGEFQKRFLTERYDGDRK